MSRAYIIDTTVVVAGLLTGRHDSPTARIVDGLCRAEFPFLLSMELLGEYRSVLLRPEIRQRHGLSEADVDVILETIVQNAMMRAPPPSVEQAPDEGDAPLWALLASDPEAVLVTGDKPLLTQPFRPGSVLTPRESIDSL